MNDQELVRFLLFSSFPFSFSYPFLSLCRFVGRSLRWQRADPPKRRERARKTDGIVERFVFHSLFELVPTFAGLDLNAATLWSWTRKGFDRPWDLEGWRTTPASSSTTSPPFLVVFGFL